MFSLDRNETPGPVRTLRRSFFAASPWQFERAWHHSFDTAAAAKQQQRASLIPLRCPLAHRRGIAIPGPFGSANRAASSKPARFFRRWRRFAAFLFPTATASLGCGGGPRFLEKENASRPVEEKIAFAAQPALRASWRKCGGLPNQYRLSIEVSYRVRSTLAVDDTAPPQLAEPRQSSWGGRSQGLSFYSRAFRFAMRYPGSPERTVPSFPQLPGCGSKKRTAGHPGGTPIFATAIFG